MAQVTIYLDEETSRRVEQQSRKAGLSVSRWIRDRLDVAMAMQWPEGFSRVFGQLADTDFERPCQPQPTAQGKREPL